MRGLITDTAAPGGLRLAIDLDEPLPEPNEVVVSVDSFAVNAGETALIEARPGGFRPGQDVAGVVSAEAADGSGPEAGSRVVAYPEMFGWAERVAVPTSAVAVLPADVSFARAATLPVAGLTALRALRVGGALLGRSVLITGASGGVGQFAVQLARASGAHVTAHVTSEARRVQVEQLGAEHIVTTIDDSIGPFHHVLDAVGGSMLRDIAARLHPSAAIVLYGNRGGTIDLSIGDFYFAGAYNAHLIAFVSTEPDATKGEDLAILLRLVSSGALNPVIGRQASWREIGDVLADLANHRLFGKAVLTTD